jgi:hypothetical protein
MPLLMNLLESEHFLRGENPVDEQPHRPAFLSIDYPLKTGYPGLPAILSALMASRPHFAEGLKRDANDGGDIEDGER